MFSYCFKSCVFLMGIQKGRTCSALDKASLGRSHSLGCASEAGKVLGKLQKGPGILHQFWEAIPWVHTEGNSAGSCTGVRGLSSKWRSLQWKTKAIQETACCQQLLMTSANFRACKHRWQCDFWNMGSVYSCNLYHICVRSFIAVTCSNLHCFIIISLN